MGREHGYITIDDSGNVTAYRQVDPVSPISLTDGGGGGLPGAARVLGPFPFAFDDVGLENGIAFYTPTVDDILLDAWIELTESFDGTTPLADVGTFNADAFGLFATNWGPADVAVNADQIRAGVLNNESPAGAPGAAVGPGSPLSSLNDGGGSSYIRVAPGRFVSTDPLKILVSQDGTTGGAPVGGTAGAGAVYLVVATPSLT